MAGTAVNTGTERLSRLSLIVLCLCALLSCKDRVMPAAGERIVVADIENVEDIRYDDDRFIESWSMVELEAGENSRVGEITQLHLFNEKIYIADRVSNALLVFDTDGSFSHRIGARGRGPQEYLSLCSFYINPGRKEITLFDALAPGRALVFDLDGKFVAAKNIPVEVTPQGITNACYMEDGLLVCYADPNANSEDVLYVLNEEDMSLVDVLSRRPIKTDASYGMSTQPYSVVGGRLHYVKWFDNNIHEWDSGETTPLFAVDSGKLLVPENYLATVAENNGGNYIMTVAQLMDEGNYSMGLKNLFETSRFIFCEFMNDSFIDDLLVWDKKQGRGVLADSRSMHIPGINNAVFSSGDKLVIHWPWQWIEGFQSWLKNSVDPDTGTIDGEILETLQNYDATADNPVLFIYDIKK